MDAHHEPGSDAPGHHQRHRGRHRGRRVHGVPGVDPARPGQRGDPGADRGGRPGAQLRAQHPGPGAHLGPDRDHRGARLRRHQPVLLRPDPGHAAPAEGGRLRPAADRHRGLRPAGDRSMLHKMRRSIDGAILAASRLSDRELAAARRGDADRHHQPQRASGVQSVVIDTPGRHRPGRRAPDLARAPRHRLRLRSGELVGQRGPLAGDAGRPGPARPAVAADRPVPGRPARPAPPRPTRCSTPGRPPASPSTTCSRSAC